MLDNEESPLRDGIVADDYGLGKTVLTLAFIHFKAQNLIVKREAGYQTESRPM